MDEIKFKKINNHPIDKVRTKNFIHKKQIIIRKKGTTVNNLIKEKNNKKDKIKDNSKFNKSAILNKINNMNTSIIKDKNDINNYFTNSNNKMSLHRSLNSTIVKPVIYHESYLKPIILPVNIRYSGNFEDQNKHLIQQIMNKTSQTIDISKSRNIEKTNKIKLKIDSIEKVDKNKENINKNSKGNNIRRKVIIQKNMKINNKLYNGKNENEKKHNKYMLLNHPLPKEEDSLIIRRIKKNSLKSNFEKRKKFNTMIPKIEKENNTKYVSENKENELNNINRESLIYKSQKLATEINQLPKSEIVNNKGNNLRKSMKSQEKINNIIVNNTLKQTYKEMVKHKTFIVGLHNYTINDHYKGPRDSIKLNNN